MATSAAPERPAHGTDGRGLMRPPVPDTFLDRKYREHGGLLGRLDDSGHVITSGPELDPMVAEARRFYGALPDAPPSLDAWKARFGVPERNPGESLQDYRDRAGVAVYYNQFELGLGRELGCAQFADGEDANGQPLVGTACYVTNYGMTFRDLHNSLRAAIDGSTPKNTVCISYRPSMAEEFQIQFYVFGADGNRQDWAQLDSLGPRPVPHVCMGCHGGTYDEDRHLARYAHFLPVDPNVVVFADDTSSPGLTRAGEEERMRAMNELALGTPLALEQQALFLGLYDGATSAPGKKSVAGWAPAGWRRSTRARDLYSKVVKPFCGTCHFAADRDPGGARAWYYDAFQDADKFLAAPMLSWICGRFEMPNAQPTMIGLWSTERGPVVVDGTAHPSAADALLAAFGADRSSCLGYDSVSDCRRGGDALCGDRHSGEACDVETGRCVPNLPVEAPRDVTAPTGVCKLDGSRGCGPRQECRPASGGPEGYDGACFSCGASSFPACELGLPCQGGLAPDGHGLCSARSDGAAARPPSGSSRRRGKSPGGKAPSTPPDS